MATVDPYHLNTISRLYAVDVGVISDDSGRCRRVSLGYILEQFLEFDVLFVGELAEVVDELEAL